METGNWKTEYGDQKMENGKWKIEIKHVTNVL